jgi:hypothetical protein
LWRLKKETAISSKVVLIAFITYFLEIKDT